MDWINFGQTNARLATNVFNAIANNVSFGGGESGSNPEVTDGIQQDRPQGILDDCKSALHSGSGKDILGDKYLPDALAMYLKDKNIMQNGELLITDKDNTQAYIVNLETNKTTAVTKEELAAFPAFVNEDYNKGIRNSIREAHNDRVAQQSALTPESVSAPAVGAGLGVAQGYER